MAALINDGNMPYGSRVLTVNGNTYIADDFTINRPSNLVERPGEFGQPTGWVLVPTLPTGSATLQLATTSTPLPEVGMSFVVDAETFMLNSVSAPEVKDQDKKVAVTFIQDVPQE